MLAADLLWTPKHLSRPSVPTHLYITSVTGSVHPALDLERLEVAERFALGPAVIAGHVTWNGAYHLWWHLRHSQNRYMDNVIVFANSAVHGP